MARIEIRDLDGSPRLAAVATIRRNGSHARKGRDTQADFPCGKTIFPTVSNSPRGRVGTFNPVAWKPFLRSQKRVRRRGWCTDDGDDDRCIDAERMCDRPQDFALLWRQEGLHLRTLNASGSSVVNSRCSRSMTPATVSCTEAWEPRAPRGQHGEQHDQQDPIPSPF